MPTLAASVVEQENKVLALEDSVRMISERNPQLAIQAILAYQCVIYRHQKLKVLEDAAAGHEGMVARTRLSPEESMLIQRVALNLQAQIAAASAALRAADIELRNLLGWGERPLHVRGVLETAEADLEFRELQLAALKVRSEVKTLERLQEALAKVKATRNLALAYRDRLVPIAMKNLAEAEALYERDRRMEIGRLVDCRSRYMQACDAYLDVTWESIKASANLAVTVGNPSVALVAPRVHY